MRVNWLLAVLLSGFSLPALGASISVVAEGDHFQGPPVFILEVNGYPVGTGTLAETNAASMFTFKIDDAKLDEAESLVLRFVNDRNAPGEGDRNLQVLSVSVNGLPFRGDQLDTHTPNWESVPGRLNNSTSILRVHRPEDGWPQVQKRRSTKLMSN